MAHAFSAATPRESNHHPGSPVAAASPPHPLAGGAGRGPFFAAEPPATKLRIALTSAIEPSWFAGLLGRIQQAHPGAEVAMQSDTSPRLVRALPAHRLDMAFFALPTKSAGLDVIVLEREPLLVALAALHALAHRRGLALSDLHQQPAITFDRSRPSAFFDHCRAVLQRTT